MLSFGSLFAGVCGKGLVAEDDTASGLAEGPAQIVGAVLNHPSGAETDFPEQVILGSRPAKESSLAGEEKRKISRSLPKL